jgi:tRNA A37 threonylcarbamoyltransferase TsaD
LLGILSYIEGVVNSPCFDVKEGTLSTACSKKPIRLEKSENNIQYTKEDLCFSLQETIFSMLVEITERAIVTNY